MAKRRANLPAHSKLSEDFLVSLKKKRIQANFNKAAETYDQSALLQATVHQALSELLFQHTEDLKLIVDLGCATGSSSDTLLKNYPKATLVGLDFAIDLLKKKPPKDHKNFLPLCADFDELPFAHNSIDCFFSNLSLQWSLDFPKTLSKLYRILKPGGYFAFTTVLDESLSELAMACEKNNHPVAVNDFIRWDSLIEMIENQQLHIHYANVQVYQQIYPSMREAMRYLKAIGGNTIVDGLYRYKRLPRHLVQSSPTRPTHTTLTYFVALCVVQKT